MRQALNLSLGQRDNVTFLLHGNYGTGKTFLLGDMLQTEGQNGPVRYLNIKGEDGYDSVKGLGLETLNETFPPVVLEPPTKEPPKPRFMADTVETLADYKEVIKEYRGVKGLRAVGIDGGPMLYNLLIRDLFGDAMPEKFEWGKVRFHGTNLFTELHYLAPIVMMTSSSDRSSDPTSANPLANQLTTPNFYGWMSTGIAGLFSFVFVMKSRVIGVGKIQRVLLTAPLEGVVVRYRTPKPLPAEIDIPEGPGGWKKVWDIINATYTEVKK